jgi:D-lactate dehydrogenase
VNILICETEEWEIQACQGLAVVHVLTCRREPISDAILKQYPDTEVLSCFVNSPLGPDLLARLPRLRLIATRSTGYDHIDLDYCAAHGITVSNVPDYGDATVAEHTFALLLAAVRHVPAATERTRRGDFSQAGLRGVELRDKVLGVIGTGRIGRRVIEIAKGFGMRVVAFDVRADDAAAERLGFRYLSLPDLLSSADIVTIHVPGGLHSSSMISDAQLAAMKLGAVLVNTSRGSLIDVSALVRALSAGKLRAVALDVLPQESLIREEAEIFRSGAEMPTMLRDLVADHALLRFENVLVTPHIAYNTEEAVRRIVSTTIENIEAFAGNAPRNVVGHSSTQTAS